MVFKDLLKSLRSSPAHLLQLLPTLRRFQEIKNGILCQRLKLAPSLSEAMFFGTVKETDLVDIGFFFHPFTQGNLIRLAQEGEYTITDVIATLEVNGVETDLTMMQKWPVRKPRPHNRRLPASTPLITGQRVIDTFFPIAKGGSAFPFPAHWIRKNCYSTATCQMVRC